MSRSSNVVHFPSDKQSGNSLKFFAMLFYLFMAFLLTFGTGLSEEGIWSLLIFGALYNYFVRHRIYKNWSAQGKPKSRVLILTAVFLLLFLLLYKLIALMAIGIGIVYWLLVGRSGREAPYFLKFHMLTALIFNFFMLMPYLILDSLITLVSHSLLLLHMSAAAVVVGNMSTTVLPLFMMGLLWGASLWLAGSVLMGRTPYIGIVTGNVRHWA